MIKVEYVIINFFVCFVEAFFNILRNNLNSSQNICNIDISLTSGNTYSNTVFIYFVNFSTLNTLVWYSKFSIKNSHNNVSLDLFHIGCSVSIPKLYFEINVKNNLDWSSLYSQCDVSTLFCFSRE